MATTVAVALMKIAQISKPGADFQIVERESTRYFRLPAMVVLGNLEGGTL